MTQIPFTPFRASNFITSPTLKCHFDGKLEKLGSYLKRGFHADCQCQISKYMSQKSIKISHGCVNRALWNYSALNFLKTKIHCFFLNKTYLHILHNIYINNGIIYSHIIYTQGLITEILSFRHLLIFYSSFTLIEKRILFLTTCECIQY